VIDTGSGMTLEQSQRLFQAFAQADASVTRKHGGSGLGLMVSRRLANLMGGDVSLLHTELGKGSAFRLTLPLEASPDAKPLDHLTHHEKRPTAECTDIRLAGRILLAEDGTDNQRLIAFHLRKAGATVDVADNGRSALELLNHAVSSSSPYDLVLTDIHMPEMDGYTLTRTLRAQGTSIPIIALTAHAMPEDRRKCLQAGCDDYATKPIDKVNLLTTCSKWIAQRSPDPTGPSNQS
jgi:CheY-like chemotaxis protein